MPLQFLIGTIAIMALLFPSAAAAQPDTPFNVSVVPVDIPNLGGLQSYAFGQHDGKWLIIGGRLDGLHRRQPWASFDLAGHNDQLVVIDIEGGQHWSAGMEDLSEGLAEQLRSTNMEFLQKGSTLYIAGGYGYSGIANDHVTFDRLVAVDVPEVIDAVINSTDLSPHFRSVTDPQFAVTGGHLEKLYDTYYLIGGQKFMGRYNPMGPDHGPGFEQEYTNQVRRFLIEDDGATLEVTHLAPYTDEDQLHRRDYNVGPQIMPDGSFGLTAFSGVFQIDVDLPFLNCVEIDSSGYTPNNDFSQYYNHYHCAHVPLYAASDNEMHTVFFGGIAQFYDSLGVLVQDDNVPFVNTIARVSRSSDGTMSEYKMPEEMPGLFGASAEFIMLPGLPVYENGVIDLDQLEGDSVLVGHIYGGIESSGRNIFWINDGTQSTATSTIYEVWIVLNTTTGSHELNPHSVSSLKTIMFPNPNPGSFVLEFNLERATDVELVISDLSGKRVDALQLTGTNVGPNSYTIALSNDIPAGHYLLTLDAGYDRNTIKILINR